MGDSSGEGSGRSVFHKQTEPYPQEVDSWARDMKVAGPATDYGFHPEISERRVKRILEARRSRSQFFNAGLFSDPAWDILLELFAAELGQRRVCVSNLGIRSKVPASTTLRWIAVLESQGLVARKNDPLDGRRIFVFLSGAGTEAMTRLLKASPTNETLL